MTVYYVGPGGNDANSGLSWAARKLTLNGAENVPVVAGDTIWVAPGVYREMLTCDVSGGAGSPITYIADVSGEHTDGVGGVVRITGSDDDITATRTSCVACTTTRNYRTFRGFTMDLATTYLIGQTWPASGSNWIIEDCTFQSCAVMINIQGATQISHIIRRCTLIPVLRGANGIIFSHNVPVDNVGSLIELCTFHLPSSANGINDQRIGGITVRDCTMYGGGQHVNVTQNLTAGQVLTVNDSILVGAEVSLRSIALGYLVEDFNSLYGNLTPRTNVAVGANSNTYPPLFDLGILHSGASQTSGFRFPPPLFGSLSQWSQVRAIADTGAATEDILGLTRPVTAGKRSWGAVQYVDMIRDTTNPRTGIACKELQDAGREQIRVPTAAVSMVFSVWVYRGANYAGVNPQMIIKQPGQADVVVTDAGAAGVYNLLTTTLTPAALPGYVVIELVSNNTAAAGAYGVFFDDLTALEA